MMVGIGVVLLAGTACASPQTGSSGPAAAPPPVASQPTERVGPPTEPDKPAQPDVPGGAQPIQPDPQPGGGSALPAEKIDGAALPEGFPRQVSSVDDGRELTIGAQEGGCGRASLELVEQSAQQVVVNVVETEPGGNVACTMDIRYPVLTVDLAEPLGDRKVVLRHELRKS